MPYDLEPARRLFDAGAYFECHELVEAAWMSAAGAEKYFLQGVIQAAAAYHKLSQGGRPGYEYLLGRARENLAKAPPERRAWAAAFAAELGKDAPRMP
jgi:predicted metal-dependent hydrolase